LLTKDPIGFAGGDANLFRYVDSVGKPGIETNQYKYSRNNPINYTDPLGLFAVAAIGTAIEVCLSNPYCAATLGAAIIVTGTAIQQLFKKATTPKNCGGDGNDKNECEDLSRIDTDTCNGITRIRGAQAGAICHASASQRYSECLRYGITGVRTPLATWNN
jgi:hypothetical protein